jgi:DNA-binding FadR family transcriptional regulator
MRVTEASETLTALRWWQEHSALDLMVEALVEALDGRDAEAARAAAEELARAVDTHVREEEDVYFPVIERLAPEQAEFVRKARQTHVELHENLAAIQSTLAEGDLEAARRTLTELLDRLRLHEQAEASLIDWLAGGAAAEDAG